MIVSNACIVTRDEVLSRASLAVEDEIIAGLDHGDEGAQQRSVDVAAHGSAPVLKAGLCKT